MNKIFLIFTLLFTLMSHSTEVVPDKSKTEAAVTCNTWLCRAETPYYKLSSQIAGITEKACRENRMDDNMFLDPLVGCLTGHWEMGKSTAVGIYELLKLLLYELPKFGIEQNKKDIATIMTGDMSPSKVAARIANIPVARAEFAWTKAKEYWEDFKKFAVELKQQLITHSKGFFCKPRKEQYEIMCRAVDEVFLTIMGPGAVINGTKWGIKTVNAVGNFVRALKAAEAAKGLSTAEKLDHAADVLRGTGAVAKAGREVMKLPNGTLREVTLPNGKKILQYHTKMKDVETGKMVDVPLDVPVDSKTRAIDANGDVGKIILNELVTQSKGKGTLVFFDINDLGVVNHFPGKSLTGDKYLTEVGNLVRSSMRTNVDEAASAAGRSPDLILKYGGDELIVIIPETDPKLVREFTQRMSDKVYRDPKIREIFNSGFEAIMNNYKELKRVNKFSDLSPEFRYSLNRWELDRAMADFDEFKSQHVRKLENLFEKRTSHGSISVGASVIRETDSVETVLLRANEQSDVVKTRYKSSLGQDISKYGTDSNVETATIPIVSGQGPITLDPVP